MSKTLVYPFDVTIAAGTPKATPQVISTTFEPNVVERIEWLFPSGCVGSVGIQIGARSVPVIPANASQFLVRSGDSSGFDLTGMHETGDWSVIGYNTGAFAHTIHVTFKVRRIEQPSNPDILLVTMPSLFGIGAG